MTEDYPADTAETGNAHPDSTTHTLVGLEYDTDYNVRVGARYTDGTPPHSDTQRPERPRLALRGPLNNQAVDEKSTPTNTHCLTEGNQPKRTPIMKLLSPSVSTKHPTSEESLHPKSFQSWRWVFLAAILLAAVTISTFYFSSAQAQGDDGAIANLQLSSTTAGTLTVSWDAASPVPTDYRIDWAKSGEDYKSWKVDDGHVYTAETATTATITDLSHDTEYKIRMRARYYRGEHEGKSWGGPWAEATITVAGEPAETPTPEPVQQPAKEDPVQEEPAEEDTTAEAGTIDTLAATDDDAGQLVLTWEVPAAPSTTPTDYHVNWAKSTEDYPADTAEAGNAHPTDTTLTLTVLEFNTDYNIRVRARYSDGENADSPWNGPWTKTTAQVHQPLPAAPFMGGHCSVARSGSAPHMVQPQGRRLHHRLPDPARPQGRLTGCHRRRHRIKFDQLHRRDAPCGPDTHLWREGSQCHGAKRTIKHDHGHCAGGKGRGSPHRRTA